MATRTDPVTSADGEFDVHLWIPEQPAPALIVCQEIFGVGSYIRAVAAELAERGYLVAAPDLFWRSVRGWAADHDEQGMAESLKLGQAYEPALGVRDCLATLDHLRALPECDGRIGAVGFCLGGTISYMLSAATRLDAAVSYYGSGVAANLDLLAAVEGPLQLVFGGSDPFIARPDVDRVVAAAAGHANVEMHVHEDAGHAFHNFEAPMFHEPAAGQAAWAETLRFLEDRLPVRAVSGR